MVSIVLLGRVVIATIIVAVTFAYLVIDGFSIINANVELECVLATGRAGVFPAFQLISLAVLVVGVLCHYSSFFFAG